MFYNEVDPHVVIIHHLRTNVFCYCFFQFLDFIILPMINYEWYVLVVKEYEKL